MRNYPGSLPDAEPTSLMSFIGYLEDRLETDPPRQKGLRTKERLKLSAARTMNDKGYHGTRVSDITAGADLAEGSFYVYFKDKAEISLLVVTELFETFFKNHLRAAAHQSTPFLSIRETNRAWFSLCRSNSGLIRAMLQLGDESETSLQLLHQINHNWYIRVVQGVMKRYPQGSLDPNAALFAVYMLGSMMDELVRRLWIYPQVQLHELLERLDAGERDIADATSVFWMRSLYPGCPLDKDVAATANLLIDWPGISPIGSVINTGSGLD